MRSVSTKTERAAIASSRSARRSKASAPTRARANRRSSVRVAEAAHGKSITASEREALEREVLGLKAGQLDSERTVDVAKNELSLKRNRLRALEDLHRRLEGVGAGARALLGKDDSRVLGLVADRIEAPEELTAAVAGLLGGLLQCVVVESREAGVELLDELRRASAAAPRSSPRARARTRRAAPAPPTSRASSAASPIGSSSPKRTRRSCRRSSATPCSARPWPTRSAFPSARRRHGGGARRHRGASGRRRQRRRGDDVASTMLEQKREMQRLMGEVARLEAHATRLSTEHNALRARLTELDTALERARQFAHEGELVHVTAEKDLARVNGDVDAARSGSLRSRTSSARSIAPSRRRRARTASRVPSSTP